MAILVWRQSANSESHSNPPCLSHKSLLSQKRVCHSRGEKFSPTENWGGNTRALGSAWLLVGISTCGLRIARGRALQEKGLLQHTGQRATGHWWVLLSREVHPKPCPHNISVYPAELLDHSRVPSLGVQQDQSTDSYRRKQFRGCPFKDWAKSKPSRNPCCDYEDTAPTHTVDTDLTTLLKAFNTDLTGRI